MQIWIGIILHFNSLGWCIKVNVFKESNVNHNLLIWWMSSFDSSLILHILHTAQLYCRSCITTANGVKELTITQYSYTCNNTNSLLCTWISFVEFGKTGFLSFLYQLFCNHFSFFIYCLWQTENNLDCIDLLVLIVLLDHFVGCIMEGDILETMQVMQQELEPNVSRKMITFLSYFACSCHSSCWDVSNFYSFELFIFPLQALCPIVCCS